jgi:spermidine synthase
MIEDNWDKKSGKTIRIDGELIYSSQSNYQHIEVFKTKYFGKLLRLDGVIQMTEFDEPNYHEMIAHVPLSSHNCPEYVLVIGGGDGGAVREILKHKDVKKVHLVEIDKEVINISKKFFPDVSYSLDDERVSIINLDGADHVKFCNDLYDVIIIDSTDPFSVGESLFEESFYVNLKNLLKRNGIVVSQSESMFYDLELIKNMHEFKKKYFNYIKYYYTMVPTYPSGNIGFQFCSNIDYSHNKVSNNMMRNSHKLDNLDDLKYYNNSIHFSSFVTPNFISNL